DNIANVSELPRDVRARAGKLLSQRLKKKLLFKGWQAIKRRSPEEARAAAHMLRANLGAHPEAILIALMATACRFSSLSYGLLEKLNSLRRLDKDPKPAVPADVQQAIRYISQLERTATETAGIPVGF